MSRALVVVTLSLSLSLGCSCTRILPAAAAPRAPRVFVTFSGEDTSTALSVRLYSAAPLAAPSLVVDGERAILPVRREVAGRSLYAFELDGLLPATRHSVVIRDGELPVAAPRTVMTLPDDERALTLVVGGDVGTTARSREMLARAAALSPDVLAIGGDLAYANGELGHVVLWDHLLADMHDTLVRKDGVTIPVVFAIGNHEVEGMGSRYDATAKEAPFWFALLSDVRDADRDEESYFKRRLGKNATLVVLDSGFVSPIEGAQRAWLADALAAERATPFRFALYHVPLFPSFRPFGGERSALGRSHWMPLFDEHALTAAFENHDHTLKRTPPLKHGRPHDDGTLYLGDGAMGHSERPPMPGREYLARASGTSHVWLVEIDKERVRYRAIGSEGATLDETTTAAGPPAAAAHTPAP